jgi:hypothetical protein
VNGAALADLGEMAEFRSPFVFGWSGVNDGESTLNLLVARIKSEKK